MYIFLQIASNHINSDRPQAVVGQICKFPHSRKKSPAKPDMVLLNDTRSSVDRSKTRCNIANSCVFLMKPPLASQSFLNRGTY